MTDYAELLVGMSGKDAKYYSSDFNISGADNATLKTLYEGLYSGELCSEIKCYSDYSYRISPEMPDYQFELSALHRDVPKSELQEHPDSYFYKAATDEECLNGWRKGTYTCLNHSGGDWVHGPLLNVDVYSGQEYLGGRLEVGYLQREYTARDLANWTPPAKEAGLTGMVKELSFADATGAVLCGAGVLIAVAALVFGAKKVLKSFR